MTKGTNNWLKQLAEAIRQKQLAETIAQGNWMKKLAKATGQRKSHPKKQSAKGISQRDRSK